MMRARWTPKINVKLQQDHENLNSFVLNDQVCSRFSCPHCVYTCNWVSDLQKHSKGQVRKMSFTIFTISSQFGRQLKCTERNNTWTIRGLQTCILQAYPVFHTQGSCGGPCGPLPPNPGKTCMVESKICAIGSSQMVSHNDQKFDSVEDSSL